MDKWLWFAGGFVACWVLDLVAMIIKDNKMEELGY